ncbi:uncharacterized protein LOC111262533 [Varroa jacobsoni]|uniref:uncharacterized protein LOC111262533 n=1 Tax=Varroa jacobsoni TaxID=62625 RepID=UPI000BF91E84|nr:uncharacterized protein LOC111262533 [Varroa jacobsoni]
MQSFPTHYHQWKKRSLLPFSENSMHAKHKSMPTLGNSRGAMSTYVRQWTDFTPEGYTRYTPPWINDEAEYDSALTASPTLTNTSGLTPSASPTFAPRPIRRRLDPGEALPTDIGEPTPPPPPSEYTVRRPTNRRPRNRGKFCVVCKESGADSGIYRSHNVKDENGVVLCPGLRTYNCPECQNGGGDSAHKVEHCPLRRARMLDQIVQEGVERRQALTSGRIIADQTVG